MLDHELNAFGMRMGLPGLAFSPQGLVALDVSGMGRLYFEKQQRHGREELLVYLARPFPPHDSTLPERQTTAALLEEAVMELARVMNHLQGA